MSVRYYLKVESKDKSYTSSYQLFGNNESYSTFDNYLRSLGINLEDESFEDVEIPDIKGLLCAIDEAIWYDVILKDGLQEKEDSYGKSWVYSEVLDFTPNLVEKKGGNYRVKESLLSLANLLINNAYLFISYSVLEWLKSEDVLKNAKFVSMKYSFVEGADFRLLGRLKNGYKLTISQI